MEFSRKRLGIPNALLKSMKAMRTMWEVGIEVGCLLVVLGLDALAVYAAGVHLGIIK